MDQIYILTAAMVYIAWSLVHGCITEMKENNN